MSDSQRSSIDNSVEQSPSGAGAFARRRQWISLTMLVVVLAIGVWQVMANYDLWANAWAGGQLFPDPATQRTQRPRSAPDWGETSIPPERILSGGVRKDGIPALTDPKFVPGDEVDFLADDARVIGFESDGLARAYPLSVLNYHEIVNDRLGDTPIAVTFCPLCDSAAVFDRRTELGEREFGVSGMLFNSNVLMYDRGGQPESLWSQIKGEGVTGPAVRSPLVALPLEMTTWKDWHTRYPKTTVLSLDTGHKRDYTRSPYQRYLAGDRPIFPVEPEDDRLGQRERVLGVWTTSGSRAYPISAFDGDAERIEQRIGEATFTVVFDPESASLRVRDASPGVQWMYSFWFAWAAFRPETEIYE